MKATNGTFDKLLRLTQGRVIQFKTPCARVALCPTLGGRVFAEVAGRFMHRVDLETVARPEKPFNNFGGGNLWPAPEGGKFGFNYRGNEWYVQPCINSQPFEIVQEEPSSAAIHKEATLTNRAGASLQTILKREIRLLPTPAWLAKSPADAAVSYVTEDSFVVLNKVSVEEALIAAWTLEQFDTTPDTVSFCAVENPASAINFDFYAHPGGRIAYRPRGFTYRTDGQRRGQVGVKVAAKPRFIGFYDLSTCVMCVRENRNAGEGLYFNMADNDQPGGPYSAADSYSIFNSDPDMRAFELETVGAAQVERGILKGSKLTTATSFLKFPSAAGIEAFLKEQLG